MLIMIDADYVFKDTYRISMNFLIWYFIDKSTFPVSYILVDDCWVILYARNREQYFKIGGFQNAKRKDVLCTQAVCCQLFVTVDR